MLLQYNIFKFEYCFNDYSYFIYQNLEIYSGTLDYFIRGGKIPQKLAFMKYIPEDLLPLLSKLYF